MTRSTRTTYPHRSLTVECTLASAGAASRGAQWRQLGERSGLGVELIPAGRRLWLDPGSRGSAAELIRLESQCCGFLDFDLVSEGGRLHLDVTSTVPGADPVIEALVGGPPEDGRSPAGRSTAAETGNRRCC